MVARIPQCDQRRLELALSDRLAEAQAEELSRHLQSCPHCQTELEQLAGDQKWWYDAKTYLSSSDELVAIDDDDGTAPSVPPQARHDLDGAGEALPLDFLTPSDQPGMLGRLGMYEVEEVVGRGGMGIVLKAIDTSLNRCVAIKVMAGHLAASAAARKRFAHEAQAAAAVVHDHVIPIYHVDTAGQTPFLVMPYVTGRSLQDRLDACGVLETREVLRIAMQTAQGLAAAHAQGLVHRDIKPANILLENGVERVRITDFGLARASDDASQTQSGFIAGTPQYMAPEQARGEPIDARADLFSLGSVMYAMCSGHPPFRAETTLAVLRRICDDAHRNVREVNPDVPFWLAAIIDKLLAKTPDVRFQTAEEVAGLLERWLAHLAQPTVIPPAEMVRPAGTKERRTALRSAALAIGCVALLATFISIAGLVGQRLEWLGSSEARRRNAGVELRSAPATATPEPAAQRPSGWPTAVFETPKMAPDAIQAEIYALRHKTGELERPVRTASPAVGLPFENELRQLSSKVESLEHELLSPSPSD
jgi:eukaryotic-like serine/threonine-protein kinase